MKKSHQGIKQGVSIFLFAIFSSKFSYAQGLVPCDGGATPCDFAALLTLISNVLDFMIYSVATPIAAIMFAYAGFLYLTAQDNEGKVKCGLRYK